MHCSGAPCTCNKLQPTFVTGEMRDLNVELSLSPSGKVEVQQGLAWYISVARMFSRCHGLGLFNSFALMP